MAAGTSAHGDLRRKEGRRACLAVGREGTSPLSLKIYTPKAGERGKCHDGEKWRQRNGERKKSRSQNMTSQEMMLHLIFSRSACIK